MGLRAALGKRCCVCQRRLWAAVSAPCGSTVRASERARAARPSSHTAALRAEARDGGARASPAWRESIGVAPKQTASVEMTRKQIWPDFSKGPALRTQAETLRLQFLIPLQSIRSSLSFTVADMSLIRNGHISAAGRLWGAHEEIRPSSGPTQTPTQRERDGRASAVSAPAAVMRSIRSFGNDDRHVMAKHSTIYPSSEDLEAVQTLVSTVECALKHVSDWMDEPNRAEAEEEDAKTEDSTESSTKEPSGGVLCGVMRIGLVAKGLLIKDDMELELVLMCREKPTETLLGTVCDNLPLQIQKLTEDKYEVQGCIPEAAILVHNTKDPKLSLKVTLTSPQMRDDYSKGDDEVESVELSDPSDLLDRQRCLLALAALRHAKWFQARVNGLKSCVIVLRILRDMCNRMTVWEPLKGWPLELICEKAIATCNRPLGAGEALRRVMECLASGILLPGGPGLHDPCEKEHTNTLAAMTNEEAEAVTFSAQHALRLLAFGQIYKVLEMDPLPSSKPSQKYLWSDKEGSGLKRPYEDGSMDDKEPHQEDEAQPEKRSCRRWATPTGVRHGPGSP
ncbi:hypothetical protein SKAU_G00358180 [Synaphobranchus kaupii]|uniref:DZF domain-containing protein n=1 Tax=Synaphobranchus kaupii TaxID=118154 RepID=A0A9Q1IGM4_SYNKA|nr:hypothetical protein SKAU_G00358180 [Synaphobranchus kaupii]